MRNFGSWFLKHFEFLFLWSLRLTYLKFRKKHLGKLEIGIETSCWGKILKLAAGFGIFGLFLGKILRVDILSIHSMFSATVEVKLRSFLEECRCMLGFSRGGLISNIFQKIASVICHFWTEFWVIFGSWYLGQYRSKLVDSKI